MKEIVKNLQPDDIVSLPAQELMKYIEGYERYHYLRQFNPTTFYELYKNKIVNRLTFDQALDAFKNKYHLAN